MDNGKPDYGDAPIEEAYKKQMMLLARVIDSMLNGPKAGTPDKETAFLLMVFPFGEREGRCNYLSNGVMREDVITLLTEQAKRFKDEIMKGKNAT